MPGPNTIPLAQGSIKNGQVVAATANANRNGTGTLGTDIFLLFTAGTLGGMVAKVSACHQGAQGTLTTALVCRLYRVNSGATVKTLISELLLPALTPTAAVAGPKGVFKDADGVAALQPQLGPSEALWVSVSVSESVAVDCNGGGDI